MSGPGPRSPRTGLRPWGGDPDFRSWESTNPRAVFLIGSRSAAPSRADQHKSSALLQSFAEIYSPPSHNRKMTKDQRASFLFPIPCFFDRPPPPCPVEAAFRLACVV